jgi:hypothetical protein
MTVIAASVRPFIRHEMHWDENIYATITSGRRVAPIESSASTTDRFARPQISDLVSRKKIIFDIGKNRSDTSSWTPSNTIENSSRAVSKALPR